MGTPDPERMNPGDEAPAEQPSTGQEICRECGGEGEVDGRRCEACGGTGRVHEAVGGG